MKSEAQVRQKLRSLQKLLARAEKRYIAALGLRSEGSWKRRCVQLADQVEMLKWVLDDQS